MDSSGLRLGISVAVRMCLDVFVSVARAALEPIGQLQRGSRAVLRSRNAAPRVIDGSPRRETVAKNATVKANRDALLNGFAARGL